MADEISIDEMNYLRAASAAFPQGWFRPHEVAALHGASHARTAQVVAALASAGWLDAEPDQHARVTPAGHKEARRLSRVAAHDARHSPGDDRRRRSRRLKLALAWVLVIGCLAALMWARRIF